MLDRNGAVADCSAAYLSSCCAGLMPVEQFMQEYFQHTTEVREIAAHFVESVKPQGILSRITRPLLSYRLDSDFRVGTTEFG
ncbi:MAG: hypothetical protein U0894_07215 [Pirellulales bacterium]